MRESGLVENSGGGRRFESPNRSTTFVVLGVRDVVLGVNLLSAPHPFKRVAFVFSRVEGVSF
jgi:hypothetical protein